MKKSFAHRIWDFFGFPLRAFILDERTQKKFGLTTLKEERMSAVTPCMRGSVLDIGCGYNDLVKNYRAGGGQGIGVDVFPFDGVDEVLDTVSLPYHDKQFDTVTMVANLNHIPYRKRAAVITEARRVLKDDGVLVITMINGTIGWFCHKLIWWDFDQKERGMDLKEENYGLSDNYVIEIMRKCAFCLVRKKSFLYGLNNLYVFRKQPA